MVRRTPARPRRSRSAVAHGAPRRTVTVLDNPTQFTNPFHFEITFECLEPLNGAAPPSSAGMPRPRSRALTMHTRRPWAQIWSGS